MPKKTFEQAMKQLEQIVEALETGDLPLEKAIAKFEEGIELSKFCSNLLDETEKKITILTQGQEDTISEKPFPAESTTDENHSG
jgi:exodeoxyribonuclease VII small subunit